MKNSNTSSTHAAALDALESRIAYRIAARLSQRADTLDGDVAERLRLLYGAYRDHPKLSLAFAGELAGRPFDARAASFDSAVVREAIFDGKHPTVQACFHVEHRARLSILKAAVDLLCMRAPPPSPKMCSVWPQLGQQ